MHEVQPTPREGRGPKVAREREDREKDQRARSEMRETKEPRKRKVVSIAERRRGRGEGAETQEATQEAHGLLDAQRVIEDMHVAIEVTCGGITQRLALSEAQARAVSMVLGARPEELPAAMAKPRTPAPTAPVRGQGASSAEPAPPETAEPEGEAAPVPLSERWRLAPPLFNDAQLTESVLPSIAWLG